MALSDMYSLSEAGMNDPLQFRSTHYVPIGSIGGAPQWGNQYSWDINGLGLGGDGDRFSITAPGGEGFHLIDRGDGTNTLFSLVNGNLQQGKTEKYDNTMHGWGGFVEKIAPYAAALMAGYAGAGIAGLGTGAGAGAAGAGEVAGTGLVAGTGTTGLQAGLGSGLTLAAPTGTGAGLAAGTGAGTIGAGIGASIPALPLAGQGGTGASYGLGGGDLGGGTGSGLSTGGSGSSLVPKTPQSTSSYSLGGSGASLTPASSGSGSGFQSFMDSVFNTNQGLTGFMNSPGYRIGSGLMQLFNAQDNNDMYRKLREMYGPNSAYAQQLRKQLERKDAASGRRSQYGPREVELQARLADMYSRNYPNMAAAQNARNMGYGQGLGLIMSGLGKTGALDSAWKGLTGLFGG